MQEMIIEQLMKHEAFHFIFVRMSGMNQARSVPNSSTRHRESTTNRENSLENPRKPAYLSTSLPSTQAL
jgi:hypothetical protein